MIGGNAYATSKAALKAHTVNLAAELAGTGVTVNAYRPGAVDTSLQERYGKQAEKIGTELRDHFANYHKQGTLLTPERSAAALLARMKGEANGEI